MSTGGKSYQALKISHKDKVVGYSLNLYFALVGYSPIILREHLQISANFLRTLAPGT